MADSMKLHRPEPGQTLSVTSTTATSLDLDFSPADATLTREADNLVFAFDDGSQIEVRDFYAAVTKTSLPDFIIEGQTVAGADFFAALSDDLQPAAGPAPAVADGGRFHDYANADLLGGVDRLGGLDYGFATATAPERTLDPAPGDVAVDDPLTTASVGSGSLATAPGTPSSGPSTPSTGTVASAATTGNSSNADRADPADGDSGKTSGTTGDTGSTGDAGPVTPPGWIDENGLRGLPGLTERHNGDAAWYNAANPDGVQIAGDFDDQFAIVLPEAIRGFLDTVVAQQPDGRWGAWATINAEAMNKLGVGEIITLQAGDRILVGERELVLSEALSLTGSSSNVDKLTLDAFAGTNTIAHNDHYMGDPHRLYTVDATGDKLDLGLGNDDLKVGTMTAGEIAGGLGDDYISVGRVMTGGVISGDAGNDTLGITHMTGGTVDGGSGNDFLVLRNMEDGTVKAGEGDDVVELHKMTGGSIDGGEGYDKIVYVGTDALNIDGFNAGSGVEGTVFNNIAFVDLLNGDDTLSIGVMGTQGGDDASTVLQSGLGNDSISIGTLYSGQVLAYNGNDVITVQNLHGGVVAGEGGDDTIIVTNAFTGGTILGGIGNDTVKFAAEGGKFSIDVFDSRVAFPNGITIANAGPGATGSVLLNSIETVEFGDNTTVTIGTMQQGTLVAGAGVNTIAINEMLGGTLNLANGDNTVTIEKLTRVPLNTSEAPDYRTFSEPQILGNGSTLLKLGGTVQPLQAADILPTGVMLNGALVSGVGNIELTGEHDTFTLRGNVADALTLGADGTFTLGGITFSGVENLVVNSLSYENTGASWVSKASYADYWGLHVNGDEVASDVITFTKGLAGNAVVNTGGGADNLTVQSVAGTGYAVANSTLNGGSGDDTILINGSVRANSAIEGGIGNDTITITEDVSTWGTTSTPLISGGDGHDKITIMGNLDGAMIRGDGGNDSISLTGSLYKGTISGDGGSDTISVGVVAGTGGIINGGDGADHINVGTINEWAKIVIDGGADNDLIHIGKVLSGATLNISGGSGNDTITIDDITTGYLPGGSIISGGDGADVFTYNSTAGHYLTLSQEGTVSIAGVGAKFSITGFEGLGGGSGNDVLTGNTGDNYLFGGDGDDILYGGDGNDFLHGGAGNDQLYGGAGNDILVYDATNTMMDGGSGIDYLVGLNKDLLDTLGEDDSLDALLGNHGAITNIDVLVFNGQEGGEQDITSLFSLTSMGFANTGGTLNLGAESGWEATGATFTLNAQEYMVYNHSSDAAEGVDLQIAVLKDLCTNG